jgi:hypothetical protein
MVEIDTAAIRERVSELEFPIYFFDLETFSPAIPRFEGLRPYDSLCFQFSCHVLGEDEKVEHFEFLEQGSEDPRIPFVNALLKVIGWQGSVVVYNASFERARLNELAQFFPEYEPDLKHIIHRLWDQLVIFKHWYLDPRFGGSNSIKRVLPVLVPQLSYSELKIQQGDEASWKWAEMIELLPGPEKDRIAQELLEYCKMDTLAMLEIHKMISQV